MKKGIVFLIVFLMVISFPICGYAKGKEKIYLDSSWKYADHARITSGYAVMYKAKKEPEGHCDCSQCGTWNERRFIGKNAVSSGWLCKGDRRNDSGRLCESSGGFRWNGISGRNGRT